MTAVLISSLLIVWGFLVVGYGQEIRSVAPAIQTNKTLNGFIQKVVQAVSYRAADLGYDYTQRPVIGVLAADFSSPAGEEIELGNEIGAALRAALNKGKQFHVYGKDHPVSQNLKTVLQTDPQWSGATQRRFQQRLGEYFKPFPVDLIITGQVSKETAGEGEFIKCQVQLSPFMETITAVEGESGRTNLRTEEFVSPILSKEFLKQPFAPLKAQVVPKGRLVVLALLKSEKGRSGLSDSRAAEDRTVLKRGGLFPDNSWKLGSLKEILCWLDDTQLASQQNWPEDKKKNYYNLLSGLNADTIWFDEMVVEGRHSFFVSLAKGPLKNQYKTFSTALAVKGGQSHYVYFTLQADAYGEPQIQIELITDSENRPLPF